MPKYIPLYSSFVDAISDLPDGDQLTMYRAIVRYGFYHEEPGLPGILSTLWKVIRPNLESAIISIEAGEKSGEKRRVKGVQRTPSTNPFSEPLPAGGSPNKKEMEREKEKEKEIEKEREISRVRDARVRESNTNNSFKKWNYDQFNDSVSKVVNENPELLPFKDAFADYWTEKSASGIYRFALQQTWDTSIRMKRWGRHNRSQQGELFNKHNRATFAGDEYAGKEERDGF